MPETSVGTSLPRTTPRNIVPMKPPQELEAVAPGPAARLVYHGGPVLSSVKVLAIFWGSDWMSEPNHSLVNRLGDFFRFILQSSLMDVLAEYGAPGRPIRHGAYLGGIILTDPAPEASVSDAQIQQTLQTWIAGNVIAQPDADTLYFVYLPPNVTSTMDGGAASCSDYCGYHNHIGAAIFYAVEPFLDCSGCQFGSGVFDSLTKVTSHELCEAITDPALNAWFDDASGNEIGDICNSDTTTLGDFVIQAEWSNSQQVCAIAPAVR